MCPHCFFVVLGAFLLGLPLIRHAWHLGRAKIKDHNHDDCDKCK